MINIGHRRKVHIFFLVFAMYFPKTYAESIPTDWNGSRSAGMGSSFTANSNDETAIFANPSGISETRNPLAKRFLHELKLPDLQVGGNPQMLSNLSSDPTNWGFDMYRSAKANFGNQSYLLLQSFNEIIVGAKNSLTILLGVPIRSENKMAFIDPNSPSKAYFVSTTTATGAIGIAGASTRGFFRYGISLRPNYRVDYQTQNLDTNKYNSTNDLVNVSNNLGYQTTAFATDAGFSLTAADYWFPTFAVAVRNIPTGCINNYTNPMTQQTETMCGTLRDGANTSAPNTSKIDPTELRAGLSLTPRGKIGKSKVNLRLSVDAYPIPLQVSQNNYGVDGLNLNQILHAGAELFFGNVLLQQGFALRGGLMEGGPTWGASMDIAFLSIEYSSYLVTDTLPTTTSATNKFVERRHLLGISYHW
ncbi:hypothetical protein ACWNT8_07010 [Pigmentibacter ruber]|uniref:hypothetical protein n=1 Tax=Pigmentibacter ruber TaxID=2683196 RepID=UPI00131AD584|nr:hypothetical protein [Pigmentibacter ruber]